MASSFPTIPSKIAQPRLTPWLLFSKRDTRIRTISHAASATRPERFAAIKSVSRAGGLSALARPEGRPAGSPSGRKKNHERNQTILRLKAKGMSNRWIAGRLGLSEKTVRKSLRRLGWKSDPEPDLPFLPKADSQAKQAPVSASKLIETPPSAAEQPPDKRPQPQTGSTAKSFDTNPLDRSMDRLLAAIGLLDDALPVFAPTRSLPRAGVLLAIPALVASGLLSTAEKIYGSLGPAFYGLRT